MEKCYLFTVDEKRARVYVRVCGLRVKCLHFTHFVQITHDNSSCPIADRNATPIFSLSMNASPCLCLNECLMPTVH